MPLYTIIYITYCILLLSNIFWKGQVKSMNNDEQVKRLLESQTISNSGIKNVLPEIYDLTLTLKTKTKKVRKSKY